MSLSCVVTFRHPESRITQVFYSEYPVKRIGFCILGIVVGLTLAAIAYHFVSMLAITVSSAQTASDLHLGWFPVRVFVALQIARLSGALVYGLRLRK